MKTNIAIIGGGLLGLSTAYFLQKHGYKDIVIIEKETNLGGACSWLEINDTIVDRFYHVIMAGDGRIFRLMNELGLQERYGFTNIKMGIFDGTSSLSISSLKEFMFYPNLSLFNKLRLAYTLIYCHLCNNWKKLETISVPDWLISVGGKKNYDSMWFPIMRSKFGDNVEKLTAADMWARIKRLSTSRRINFSQKMAYIKGTPKTLIDRLEYLLVNNGAKIIKGNRVNKITAANETINKITLEDATDIESNAYIFTTSIPDFEKLVPPEYSEYKISLRGINYLNNVCLILKLRKPLTPYYMLNIQDSSIPFTGVIGLSHIYPETEFDGYLIFYISKYFFGNNDLFHKSKEEILSEYLPHLRKINPQFDESWIKGFELSKGKYIEPFHSINYSRHIPNTKTIFKNSFLLTTAQIYPQITVLNNIIHHAEDFVNKTIRQEHTLC